MKKKYLNRKSKAEHWVRAEPELTSSEIIVQYQKKFPEGQSYWSIAYEQNRQHISRSSQNKKTMCEQEKECVEKMLLSNKKVTAVLEQQVKNFSNESPSTFKIGGYKCADEQGGRTASHFKFNAGNITEKAAMAAASVLLDKISSCVASQSQMVDSEKASEEAATASVIVGVCTVMIAGFMVGWLFWRRQGNNMQEDDITEDYDESPTPLVALEANLPRSRTSSSASVK